MPNKDEKIIPNYFEELYKIDVSDKVEKKGNLSYLSWPYAWAELKKKHPTATFTIYENAQGWNYHTDGRTCWVKTGVTVDGIEHIEELPVMNNGNKSIPLASVTSFEVNKTIQRSLTKAAARHGLGLYIYAGEDLPEAPESAPDAPAVKNNKTTPKTAAKAEKAPQSATQAQAKPAPVPQPTPQPQAQATQPDPERDAARAELREFMNLNGLDNAVVAAPCGLNKNSTAKDFRDALDYAKNLVRLMGGRET